jgi:membrane-associated phospholipid phosphatase
MAPFPTAPDTGRRVPTTDHLLEAITLFGDPGFILPASAGLAAALLLLGDRRTGFGLAAAVTACGAVTILAKLLFMAFGPDEVYSPSGHTSMATVLYASCAALAYRSSDRPQARLASAGFVALFALVAASRIVLEVHTAAETLVGAAIGLASFALFRRFASQRPPIGVALLAAGLAAGVALHATIGLRVNMEDPVERVAIGLARALQR